MDRLGDQDGNGGGGVQYGRSRLEAVVVHRSNTLNMIAIET